MITGSRILACIALLATPHIALADTWKDDNPQETADYIYECGLALDWGEQHAQQSYRVDSVFTQKHLDSVISRNKGVSEDTSAANIKKLWSDTAKSDGQAGLRTYILDTARDCEQIYLELLAQERGGSAQPAPQPPANESTQISQNFTAADLRNYVRRTGNHAAVADYIVYKYPNGKDPFGDSPEGELLGELIVEIGAKGVIRFSDAAILAIIGNHYWQYNPPASRIAEAEYQRRLRVRKYNAAQSRSWAERAAADRARQAREANAKPVGSLGRHCEKYYDPGGPGVGGAWITKCR
ncbi:hypothetical protein [Croceicoccus estronivorus]|uniref:hypothetical protein n=1 Tax=Croceicoccus estronivorus TaxID=1172626 RepID=UPI000AF83167|nr:hypothetical protein [Croceicoccus estronivorus]